MTEIEANTKALEANTKAVAELTAVWNKLYARAVHLNAQESGTLTAAGVKIADIPPTKPFVL